MKIDFHNHYNPKRYYAELEKKNLTFLGHKLSHHPHDNDLGIRDKEMKQMGADMAVLSIVPPGVDFLQPVEAVRLAKEVNDELAGIANSYPEKYAALAVLPLKDVSKAVEEFDRAVKELGMRGAVLYSNVGGKIIASEEFYPIFERAEQLDVPIFMHPGYPMGMEVLKDCYKYVSIVIAEGLLFDSTLAVTRMIFDGVFDTYSNLKLVLAHLGGVLPYIAQRIDNETKTSENDFVGYKSPLKKPFGTYLRRIYVDSVSHHAPAYMCALETLGSDKILLGSDYPYNVWWETVTAVEKLKVSKDVKESIFSHNAVRLLKLKDKTTR